MNIRQRQAGLSLVEILVALVIAIFLLGGIVQVYVGNKKTYRFNNALAEVQENGRFALETMARDLRQVGHWGCIELDRENSTSDSGDSTVVNDTVVNHLTGEANFQDYYDFVNSPAIEGTDNGSEQGVYNNSDTITIRGSKQSQANVTAPFDDQTESIHIKPNDRFAKGDIVMVMRCGENDIEVEADLFRATSSDVDGATRKIGFDSASVSLSQTYNNDAIALRLQTVTYKLNTDTDGNPVLMRNEFDDEEELISGIYDMQVLYGVDNDGDDFANVYKTSGDLQADEFVTSVRIMLLVGSSEKFVTDAKQTLYFNGADIVMPDNRLYQVFSTTIALRNNVGTGI